MYDAGRWRIQKQDFRSADWTAAHRLLPDFIQETGTSSFTDGTSAPTKVALSKSVKPHADF